MDLFRGNVQDCFEISGHAYLLSLTEVKGAPSVGMRIRSGKLVFDIDEVGRNSTDGQSVSSRSCLTGKPCAFYWTVGVELNGSKPMHGDWVTEEASH